VKVKHVTLQSFKLLPARPGACAICARDHSEYLPHDATSIFYMVRFRMKWKRDPTWADACAHLTDDERAEWKVAMKLQGVPWSEPTGDPIREPYCKA